MYKQTMLSYVEAGGAEVGRGGQMKETAQLFFRRQFLTPLLLCSSWLRSQVLRYTTGVASSTKSDTRSRMALTSLPMLL